MSGTTLPYAFIRKIENFTTYFTIIGAVGGAVG
jgi:hypothetical protein